MRKEQETVTCIGYLKEDHFSAERKLLDPWHSSITCKAVQQD
jgi:hypothetical protein